MKTIYNNPDTFKYVFEKFYSNRRSPFTTAYHEFMSYLNSGLEFEETVNLIAEGILLRMLKEKNNNNIYIVFK
jgi:hypothetical protein